MNMGIRKNKYKNSGFANLNIVHLYYFDLSNFSKNEVSQAYSFYIYIKFSTLLRIYYGILLNQVRRNMSSSPTKHRANMANGKYNSLRLVTVLTLI